MIKVETPLRDHERLADGQLTPLTFTSLLPL